MIMLEQFAYCARRGSICIRVPLQFDWTPNYKEGFNTIETKFSEKQGLSKLVNIMY